MNLLDFIYFIYERVFHIILLFLFFLVWRIISSENFESRPVAELIQFKKGNTIFQDLPRPNSLNFEDYLHVSLLITPTRQRELVMVLSKLINDILDVQDAAVTKNLSNSSLLLIKNPMLWIQQKYDDMKVIDKEKWKEKREYLYSELEKILIEVEQFKKIPIITIEE